MGQGGYKEHEALQLSEPLVRTTPVQERVYCLAHVNNVEEVVVRHVAIPLAAAQNEVQ
ncbi:hypothetical protein, conserved in T. vivax [Trypanosoma vivax Y486]|uniref:Uncharacterized protein n=1 Tax=Trypanosoma vivax (strain Y486) TaxID=1055687 RepID=F9WTZ8_TRYVY|nr:hypothetical protein, conserved in T. vivax [Trypanosoma vivax Y486]|eukprot:CCD21044.1 hypothetical protein, conserved in T. vivax [Trypanosoma vivax Y486]